MTAWLMRAVRFSSSFSRRAAFLAMRVSIWLVLRSRKCAIYSCSSSGGNGESKPRISPFDLFFMLGLLPVANDVIFFLKVNDIKIKERYLILNSIFGIFGGGHSQRLEI